MLHFRSSDKGYKSDSSQFRSKSQTTTQTTTSPLSSLSDVEDVELPTTSNKTSNHSSGQRSRHSSKRQSMTHEEPPLYTRSFR